MNEADIVEGNFREIGSPNNALTPYPNPVIPVVDMGDSRSALDHSHSRDMQPYADGPDTGALIARGGKEIAHLGAMVIINGVKLPLAVVLLGISVPLKITLWTVSKATQGMRMPSGLSQYDNPLSPTRSGGLGLNLRGGDSSRTTHNYDNRSYDDHRNSPKVTVTVTRRPFIGNINVTTTTTGQGDAITHPPEKKKGNKMLIFSLGCFMTALCLGGATILSQNTNGANSIDNDTNGLKTPLTGQMTEQKNMPQPPPKALPTETHFVKQHSPTPAQSSTPISTPTSAPCEEVPGRAKPHDKSGNIVMPPGVAITQVRPYVWKVVYPDGQCEIVDGNQR